MVSDKITAKLAPLHKWWSTKSTPVWACPQNNSTLSKNNENDKIIALTILDLILEHRTPLTQIPEQCWNHWAISRAREWITIDKKIIWNWWRIQRDQFEEVQIVKWRIITLMSNLYYKRKIEMFLKYLNKTHTKIFLLERIKNQIEITKQPISTLSTQLLKKDPSKSPLLIWK